MNPKTQNGGLLPAKTTGREGVVASNLKWRRVRGTFRGLKAAAIASRNNTKMRRKYNEKDARHQEERRKKKREGKRQGKKKRVRKSQESRSWAPNKSTSKTEGGRVKELEFFLTTT